MNYKEFINSILNYASQNNFTDIHLNTDSKIRFRNKVGDIEELNNIGEKVIGIMSFEDIVGIIRAVIGEDSYSVFLDQKEHDSSYKITEGTRYRVNTYMDSLGYSMAFRLIPRIIPTLEELGLGETVKEMCTRAKGLILVTGPTGSGKSTNLASMINYINSNYKKHIITIEDPIEYTFDSKNSLVNQREVGSHTLGFSEAIRATLREDPDVIMLGEMRDAETIKAALTIAETGHLVLSTLHTNDSVQTIDRIVDIFPPNQQAQIRMQLSQTLVGVLSQRLLPRLDGEGRIASREILVADDAVRNLIITGKTHQLYSVLEVGASKGMILMDKYLLTLYNKQKISKETLMSYVRDKDSISLIVE